MAPAQREDGWGPTQAEGMLTVTNDTMTFSRLAAAEIGSSGPVGPVVITLSNVKECLLLPHLREVCCGGWRSRMPGRVVQPCLGR